MRVKNRRILNRISPLFSVGRDSKSRNFRRVLDTCLLVVDEGKLAGMGAHSYSAGDATKGSEDASRFKGA
jgi:hypothetical protein